MLKRVNTKVVYHADTPLDLSGLSELLSDALDEGIPGTASVYTARKAAEFINGEKQWDTVTFTWETEE